MQKNENKIKIKSQQTNDSQWKPFKKNKLKVDLPSPPRVRGEEIACGGCRGPSLSTKGPHTDACPLWDPPLSSKGFILSFKGQYIDACLVHYALAWILDPKKWQGEQKKS